MKHKQQEKKMLLPPQDMMFLVNRIASGERILRYKRKKANFILNDETPNHRSEHFWSWALLAAVYYENVGMLKNILSELKKHQDVPLFFTQDNKVKYIATHLRVGSQHVRFAWNGNLKNLLYWAIHITNNPVITEILYKEGGSLEYQDPNEPYRFPYLTTHLFSLTQSETSNFSLSREEFERIYNEAAARNEDVSESIAIPFQKWIENRLEIIKLVIKYEKTEKTVFRKEFLEKIKDMHVEYPEKNELNMTVFFRQGQFKPELLKKELAEKTIADKNKDLKLLSTFQFAENSPLLKLYDELRQVLPADNCDINDVVMRLYNLKFLRKNWTADFKGMINAQREHLKSKLHSPTSFERAAKSIIDQRKSYNIPRSVVRDSKKFEAALLAITELPDDLFKDKGEALDKISPLLAEVAKEIGFQDKQLPKIIRVFNLDKINNLEALKTYITEQTFRLQDQIQKLDSIYKYWTGAVNTLFFTTKKKAEYTLYLSTQPMGKRESSKDYLKRIEDEPIEQRKMFQIPIELINYIVSFLNFGDIKLKNTKNILDPKSHLKKPLTLPKIKPQLERPPKRRKHDNENSDSELINETPSEAESSSDESSTQHTLPPRVVNHKRPAEQEPLTESNLHLTHSFSENGGKRPRISFRNPSQLPTYADLMHLGYVQQNNHQPVAPQPLAQQPFTELLQNNREETMIQPESLFDQEELELWNADPMQGPSL